MPTTAINGLPSPDDNSPNDPPIHFQALNAQLDTRLLPRFTTAAARDAAITAPQLGMFCVVAGALQEYNTSWGLPLTYGIDMVRTGTVAISDSAINYQGFAAGDVVRDRGGFFTSSGTTIATVPTGLGGKYLVSVGGSVDGGAQNARLLFTVDVNASERLRANGFGEDVAHTSRILYLNAGDILSLRALQARGTGRSLTYLYLSLHQLGS